MILFTYLIHRLNLLLYIFPTIIYLICKLKKRKIKKNNEYASFERRALAFLVDFILLMIFGNLIHNISILPQVLPSILVYVFSITNMIILPIITGWSLGKRIVAIKIVKKSNNIKADFYEIIYREIVKSWFSVPLLFIGCLWMLFGKNKLTWHDSVSDTRVIYMYKRIKDDTKKSSSVLESMNDEEINIVEGDEEDTEAEVRYRIY